MDYSKYETKLEELELLVKTAVQISIATYERRVYSWQEKYASHFFAKISSLGISLIRLLPKSSLYYLLNNKEIWDISSVCCLARSLIDTYNAFYYLTIDYVKKEEADFRYIVWQLHSECERLKGLTLIGSQDPRIDETREEIENLKEEIKANKFYQALDSKSQKVYWKGGKGIFLTNSKISEGAGINPNFYKFAYKFFSNHIHSYPFAISQIAAFKEINKNTINLFIVAIEDSQIYISLSIRDFLMLFPDQKSKLSKEVEDLIKKSEILARWEI